MTVCPTCNGSALIGLCGRTDLGSDGPCVLRSGHNDDGRSVCYGEGDVASDWTPASSCPDCCVCPCGYTDGGATCRYCGATMRPGVYAVKDPATHRVTFP